ncbi:MAG: hypothetical protein K0S83_1713, partial [Thermomicrobiales bacterium]|nr:hypothetical protein [Thermomicrobiales bacterium]
TPERVWRALAAPEARMVNEGDAS